MKKSLLAVAAMTAFAGAAQAQSSVTVYGILDVGFVNSNYTGTKTKASETDVGNATQIGSATQKQVANGFGQSAESTSRLGFKGTEDLGGGASAIFTVEVALSPMTSGSTTNSGVGFEYNRQAFVGLDKKGVGTATIGTQYTPMFDVQSITDAAGNNNMVGNAVYSGNLQSSTGTWNNGLEPYTGNTSSQSLNMVSGAYTTRVSNALKFQSDRVAGVKGELFYAQAAQSATSVGSPNAGTTATANGGTNNNTAWGINADYVWNKLQAVAAYQSIKSYNPAVYAGAAGSTSAQGSTGPTEASGSAGSFGNNMIDNQVYAAVTYDFGILKGYYQYINRKAVSVIDNSYYTKRSANQIGVRSQLTPVISAFATFGLTNAAYYGQGLPTANGRTFQIGADYYLSKRTNLYVIGGAANQSSNGATTAANIGAGTSASNYAVGVRHTF